jgi:hypothetical protein
MWKFRFLCVFFCFYSGLQAQEKLQFGLKGGLNMITITVESDFNKIKNVASKSGFQLGGFLHVSLSEDFVFQPEVIYTEQNYSYTAQSPLQNGTKNYLSGKLGYVSIPLILVYYPTERLGIELGPQISFLNKHAVKNTTEFISVFDNFTLYSYTENYALSSISTETEFSFNAGLSFKILDHLQFSARYGYSFTELIKEKEFVRYSIAHISAKNIFQLNLGILF